MAYPKENTILFICFVYFITYVISFSNPFNNLINLEIQLFFIQIQKLSDNHRLYNPILSCKLLDLLLNISLY